jgi:hypothetical protein
MGFCQGENVGEAQQPAKKAGAETKAEEARLVLRNSRSERFLKRPRPQYPLRAMPRLEILFCL